MTDPADALEAAAHRLEQVARRLAEDGVPPDELRALADEALQLGQEITDTLPRALRDASSGAVAREDDPLDPRVQVVVLPPNEPGAAGHASSRGSGAARTGPRCRCWRAPLDHAGAARPGGAAGDPGPVGYAAHPELTLVNLPTAFIESGVRLLKELGTYVLARGVLEEGDIMQLRADLPYLVGIAAPAPRRPRMGGGLPALRVVMLA